MYAPCSRWDSPQSLYTYCSYYLDMLKRTPNPFQCIHLKGLGLGGIHMLEIHPTPPTMASIWKSQEVQFVVFRSCLKCVP